MRNIEMDNMATGTTVHVFEACGLGKAPFTYTGVRENRYSPAPGVTMPGGTCNYCGTGIAYEFSLRSADGRHFVVGSDCIAKSGDAGLRRAIRRDEADLRREKARALVAKKQDEIGALLADEALRAKLAGQPHPNAYYASQGRTLLHYYEFIVRASGASGKARILKALRAIAA